MPLALMPISPAVLRSLLLLDTSTQIVGVRKNSDTGNFEFEIDTPHAREVPEGSRLPLAEPRYEDVTITRHVGWDFYN